MEDALNILENQEGFNISFFYEIYFGQMEENDFVQCKLLKILSELMLNLTTLIFLFIVPILSSM